MDTVSQLGTTPVKSGQLLTPDEVWITPDGIAGDRRFLIVDEDGNQLGRPGKGAFVGVRFEHDADAETLSVTLPDGRVRTGNAAADGAALPVDHLGLRTIPCHEVSGPWPEVLSGHVGRPVRLVRVDEGTNGVDVLPITLLGTGSVRRLEREVGAPVDPRRFRASILVDAAEHAEDGWDGRLVQVGQARLRVRSGVPRCVVTSYEPVSGVRDLNVLRGLARYRPTVGLPDGMMPGFSAMAMSVYAQVESGGRVRVGDEVRVVDEAGIPDAAVSADAGGSGPTHG